MIGESGGAPTELNFMHKDENTPAVPYNGYAILGGAANDVLGAFYVPFKCKIKRFGFYITEACVCETQSPVFYFDEADAGTVPTEDGDIGIVTIPSAQAAGTMVYQDLRLLATQERNEMEEGTWVVVSLQTDATSGSTVAGKVMPFMLVEYVPEVPANNTAMTEVEA